MESYEHSRFATELNRIFDDKSRSPEDVVIELNRRGFPLPLHTFSYWLQGYFLPRSESAFQVVNILESILGVSDSRLSDALLEDLSSGASFVPGEFAELEVTGEPPQSMRFPDLVDSTADWEASPIQKVVRDDVHLSADRRYVRYKVTILARVPSVPNPTFFFQLFHPDGVETGRGEYFYDVSGMTVKKQEVCEEEGTTVCSVQFALLDDVVPGDLHKLSYAWDEKSRNPVEKICDRFVPWTLDFYSSKVTFEGGIPEGVRYVTCNVVDGRDIEISNDIPLIREGNSVSVSVKNFGNCAGYFEVPPTG